ncbi:MAG: aspartate/glutamate racemase family protein, partial [Chlamydiia bacterium]|nr:aspartate/glutamate racemase family protein [Chlamydiia bacterium]
MTPYTTLSEKGPIGVFDSGMGGLTVMRRIRALLPDEPLVYFGDTSRVPYGNKSPETIVRYSLEAASFFKSQGVKALVVACNTASSYALTALEYALKVPV